MAQSIDPNASTRGRIRRNFQRLKEQIEAAGAITPNPQTYTITNVSTDRAFDANSTTVNELADVLGTLIADLEASGII